MLIFLLSLWMWCTVIMDVADCRGIGGRLGKIATVCVGGNSRDHQGILWDSVLYHCWHQVRRVVDNFARLFHGGCTRHGIKLAGATIQTHCRCHGEGTREEKRRKLQTNPNKRTISNLSSRDWVPKNWWTGNGSCYYG